MTKQATTEALDVYYHPFAYGVLGTVVDDDSRLAGAAR
jgi:hypothetical protein